MRKRILNQPIDVIKMEEAVYRIKAALFHKNQFKIITLNPEMIIEADENFEFQAAINNANMIVPDGIGIIWALNKANPNEKNLERIPGIDLAIRTLEIANELEKKVALFGSSEKILISSLENLRNIYPSITFTKSFHGFLGEEKDKEIAHKISEENPDVVFVALGSPRQEIWINKFSKLFLNSVMIGVGGSFDIWSGEKKRAPGWMIDLNLEWFYRVACEPKRISRILKTHPLFIMKVLKTNS